MLVMKCGQVSTCRAWFLLYHYSQSIEGCSGWKPFKFSMYRVLAGTLLSFLLYREAVTWFIKFELDGKRAFIQITKDMYVLHFAFESHSGCAWKSHYSTCLNNTYCMHECKISSQYCLLLNGFEFHVLQCFAQLFMLCILCEWIKGLLVCRIWQEHTCLSYSETL